MKTCCPPRKAFISVLSSSSHVKIPSSSDNIATTTTSPLFTTHRCFFFVLFFHGFSEQLDTVTPLFRHKLNQSCASGLFICKRKLTGYGIHEKLRGTENAYYWMLELTLEFKSAIQLLCKVSIYNIFAKTLTGGNIIYCILDKITIFKCASKFQFVSFFNPCHRFH